MGSLWVFWIPCSSKICTWVGKYQLFPSVNGCLLVCGELATYATLPSPYDNWHRLQQTLAALSSRRAEQVLKVDGWEQLEESFLLLDCVM